MNKKLLIISPYFPPTNAADMQRVRMSLPYYGLYGWDAEVITVDPQYSNIAKDELLLQSIPENIKIHYVNAFNKGITSKFGLGSIALRSLRSYRKKVNELLQRSTFDLIYFSTTQFPVCILGAYWKKHFNVPYVIDMQDPWHSDYYSDKPKDQRPPKHWFSYRLNKYLEPKAMKAVSGLISVSANYIDDLKAWYPAIKDIPAATITFGAFEPDLQIAEKNKAQFKLLLDPAFKSLVYVGRGGNDMHKAVSELFRAFKQGLEENQGLFGKIRLYFIGTSYAPSGQGNPTILPLAKAFNIADYVTEITDRISYYHTLVTLQQADTLFIPGSDDPKYTASKIYPYLLVKKPLLAVFNKNSSAINILHQYKAENVFSYDMEDITGRIMTFLQQMINDDLPKTEYDQEALKKYSALNMTRLQCQLFDSVIHKN